MKTGKKFPCLVTEINQTHFRILYLNNFKVAATLVSVEKLKIDDLGIVFRDDRFVKDFSEIENFISRRNKLIADEMKLQETEKAKLIARTITNADSSQFQEDSFDPNTFQGFEEDADKKMFSFGVLYIPYYSGKIYYLTTVGYPETTLYAQEFSDVSTTLEAQFAFLASRRIHLTLNVGYRTSYSKERSENRTSFDGNSNFGGSESINGLKIFDLTLGVKYYLIELPLNGVGAFVLAAGGKQFAAAEYKFISFNSQPPASVSQNNAEEYLEKLNSPLHYMLGFGVEYSFNKSLSLFTSIRFSYSRVNSQYDSREFNSNTSYTSTRDVEYSSTTTQVGIGFNFYF